MKKRRVITTEKREVWVVREAIPEPPQDQTIDISNAIEVPSPESGCHESGDLDNDSPNVDLGSNLRGEQK
jgi:hypothetical protein